VDGVYAFHAGGAQAAFVDGHVQMLRQGMNIWVLFALTTAQGDEVVNASDF
jgi:prepilin-type processing-associated H-X9-DG protein